MKLSSHLSIFFNNDYFFLGLLSFASISATGINWYGQNEEYKSSQKNTKNVFNFSKFDNIAEAEAAGSAQKLFLATYLLNVIGAAILNNSPSYLFVFSVKETQYTHYQTPNCEYPLRRRTIVRMM
jgi:hypothetical protein